MPEPKRLYLIRHGQTELNREQRFRGRTGIPLNGAGRRQAWGAARVLAGSGVEVVYTSPLKRALETANIVAGALGARVDEDGCLLDVDYGDWQGLTLDEVREKYGAGTVESWRDDPGGFTFPGGESMADVRDRLEEGLPRLADGPHLQVAAVTHMAVLKTCFLVLMGLPFEYFWKVGISTGSVSCFSFIPGRGFTLESWNVLPASSGS